MNNRARPPRSPIQSPESFHQCRGRWMRSRACPQTSSRNPRDSARSQFCRVGAGIILPAGLNATMLRKQGGHIGQLAEIPPNKSPPWHMPKTGLFLAFAMQVLPAPRNAHGKEPTICNNVAASGVRRNRGGSQETHTRRKELRRACSLWAVRSRTVFSLAGRWSVMRDLGNKPGQSKSSNDSENYGDDAHSPGAV